MAFRATPVLAVLSVLLLAVGPAEGGGSRALACGAKDYSYAGLESRSRAGGISAAVVSTVAPTVVQGHVSGWIGVGGTAGGPHGTPEWLQVGVSAWPSDRSGRIYYEVTVPGSHPRYVELDSDVAPGESHRFSVLEMAARHSWWRVWMDGRPVSPPLHLPGSHEAWYPQAVAESWNGGAGSCNAYSYRFSNVKLAQGAGGLWKALTRSDSFADAGYRVVETSRVPRSFLARRSG